MYDVIHVHAVWWLSVINAMLWYNFVRTESEDTEALLHCCRSC